MKKPIQTKIVDVPDIKMSKEKSTDIDLEYEIQLLYAMQGFKPVGISKHFQMTCIIERLQENMEKTVSSKSIWEHLNKWYNLQQLNENEVIPFQNQEIDFNLPDSEYGALKQKKSIMPVVKTPSLPSTPDKPNTPVTSQTKISSSTPTINKKSLEPTPKDSTTKTVTTSQKEETKKESVTPSNMKSNSTQRRDSFSLKSEQSKISSNSSKKDFNQPGNTSAKKIIEKRGVQTKGRNQNTPNVTSSKTKHSSNELEKTRDHNKNNDKDDKDNTASVKRTTRGSLKPDESENSKSQSPLTVSTPTSSGGSAPKRRRI